MTTPPEVLIILCIFYCTVAARVLNQKQGQTPQKAVTVWKSAQTISKRDNAVTAISVFITHYMKQDDFIFKMHN